MMNVGWLLVMLLGLVWTAIGITVSEGRRKGCPVQQFYFTGSLFAVLILVSVAGAAGVRGIFAAEARPAVLGFCIGSLLNGAGQAISMMNLTQGGRALAYAIPQQAFLFPYLWSIAFWGQRRGALSVVGILLIGGAIFYLAAARNADRSSSLPVRRIAVALLAMHLLGASQIVIISAARSEAARTLSEFASASVILGANAVFFLGWSLIRRRGFGAFRLYLPFGAVWGACAAASYCILLTALTVLGKDRQEGIVFPLGAGILILLYSLFTAVRYREKLNWHQVCAFAALVCGIFCAKLG